MMTRDLPMAGEALLIASRAVAGSPDPDATADALVALAEALREAGGACDVLARCVIPEDVGGTIGERYRSAADHWPAPSRPSHEQLVAILSTLHDTAAAARLAARRCDRAVSAVSATHGADDGPR